MSIVQTLEPQHQSSSTHLVDLFPQLVRDLSLLGLHQLTHHGEDVLATLRPGVCRIEVVERHVLDHLLPLVHVALGKRHIPEIMSYSIMKQLANFY